MTDEIISSHIVAAMLALNVAKKAAASRAGWDSVEEWSRAWGGVVTAQRALSAAAGPNLEAQAASLEPLETGDCAEYLRACLWALETKELSGSTLPFYELSIVPVLTALLRYLLVLENGGGAAPEEVFAHDRVLQVMGVAWVVLFGLGVYLR